MPTHSSSNKPQRRQRNIRLIRRRRARRSRRRRARARTRRRRARPRSPAPSARASLQVGCVRRAEQRRATQAQGWIARWPGALTTPARRAAEPTIVRERRAPKPVQRLPVDDGKAKAEPAKIEKGKGEALGSIEAVELALEATRGVDPDLKRLHRILFPGALCTVRPSSCAAGREIRNTAGSPFSFRCFAPRQGWPCPASDAALRTDHLTRARGALAEASGEEGSAAVQRLRRHQRRAQEEDPGEASTARDQLAARDRGYPAGRTQRQQGAERALVTRPPRPRAW